MARHAQFVRALTVAQALAASRRGVALRDLAERHGWQLRTLYRDIEALEEAGLPIVHEGGRYRLMEGYLPAARLGIDSEELAALFVARQLASGIHPTTVGKALDRLWNKLTSTRGPTVAHLPAGEPWLSVRAPFAIDYAVHARTVSLLERAIRQRLAVSCRYRALSTREISARVIEPGELHWDPGLESLYCIAWCRLRRAVRVFAVHRFLSLTLTKDRFVPRPETRSRAALRHAFRVWRGETVQRVRVRFASDVADEIRERRWHGSQRLRELPGGAVELTCEVAGLQEVERWVRSFGPSARVLEPKSLAAKMAAPEPGKEARREARRSNVL